MKYLKYNLQYIIGRNSRRDIRKYKTTKTVVSHNAYRVAFNLV